MPLRNPKDSGEALITEEDCEMIKLTKFKTKDHVFVLNAELIETVEETPDTVITLVNGNKVLVEEDMDQVVKMVIRYKQQIGGMMR